MDTNIIIDQDELELKENEKELFWDLNTNPLIGVGNHTQPQEQHG